jgi:hypothetical protein
MIFSNLISVIFRCRLLLHFSVQIRLEHGAQNGSPHEVENGAYEVDVDHSTAICDGVESVNIVATVTGTALP